MNAIVVVPNHLPHLDFLHEWRELDDVEIIVVQDIGDKPKHALNVTVFDHADIDKDLGKKSWIIPTRSSACRSYGYYKAWQREPDFIITLDNDCYPDGSPLVEGHRSMLKQSATLDWVSATPEQWEYCRGFPYGIRGESETWLNHGVWSGVPDFDAATSLHNPKVRFKPVESSVVIPRWNFFPMCGMNLAWRTELTPALYFGLFGPDYGFDQYDDIWAGVLVKKVLDHIGYAARSGFPSVEHRKQSNVFVNMKKQAPGMQMNEVFWATVQEIKLSGVGPLDSYIELILALPDSFPGEPEGWTKKFKRAALCWADLFH